MSSTASDFAWLCEHSLELDEKYRGKWIAVHAGKVIGIGETAVEADGAARAAYPDTEFVLHAVESDFDVIYACL